MSMEICVNPSHANPIRARFAYHDGRDEWITDVPLIDITTAVQEGLRGCKVHLDKEAETLGTQLYELLVGA